MDPLAEQTRWLDATAQAELVAGGDVSASELVEAAIHRIEELDGELNAVVIRWFDHARSCAADQTATGPFAGVPFLLKDLWGAYAGQSETGGNQALAKLLPKAAADSTFVARTRQAGLVALGRTSSPELGSLPVTEPLAHGPTRNPWNTGHTPGGSSGGSSAAVAAGMVPIAHASDGGGSIRIPAACTGLVGLKPSQGRISAGPSGTEAGLAVQLCVSRSVRDVARFLDAVAGPGIGDTMIAPAPARPYADELGVDPGKLRIGFLDHHPVQGRRIHDEATAAARAAAGLLEGLGHHVEAAFPDPLSDPNNAQRFMAIWSTQMAMGIKRLGQMAGRELTEDDVEPVNWALARFAEKTTAVDLAQAQTALVDFRRATQQWWADGWDLLVTPTLGEPPLAIGSLDPTPTDPMAGMRRSGDFAPFTPAYNMSGQPAISLPLHWTADGLPLGVQLVAAYGREDVLIQVASQLEAAHPWASQHP